MSSTEEEGVKEKKDYSKPQNAESDPRIAFDQVSQKWIMEEQNLEYHWDEQVGVWRPKFDEGDLSKQQEAYGSEEPQADKKKRKNGKKRRRNDEAKKERVNTAIYISNLPNDTTEKELEETFSKYGVIGEDLHTDSKRIKLYRDENDKLKGDGLIHYFRPESVDLAIQMMDGTDLRLGVPDPKGPIRVEKAQFEKAGENEGRQKEPVKLTDEEKIQIRKKMRKLNSKIADWEEDDERLEEEGLREVVLKYVFSMDELEQDDTAILDIKEDIRDGCEEIGVVTNVTLYDLEPDGIVVVKFKDASDAEACVRRMKGRYFSRRKLDAYLYDGAEKFRRRDGMPESEEDNEEQDRLEKFGEWLEEEEEEEEEDDQ
ncbi:cold sensitive U2 snRNA suppressor 2 [Trichomonascus vanleenenianus]|uniref:U2 snRNP complex subunit CUS2 n=1 Tax=Trichomonascus vanleenenianus TaxID=2268995 RepID=UPI003ECB1422